MPRVVFTHAVADREHWAGLHEERVAAFRSWGTNIVDHLCAAGSNNVAVSVDVHDMEAMQRALASPELAAAKRAHGVIDPVAVLVGHR